MLIYYKQVIVLDLNILNVIFMLFLILSYYVILFEVLYLYGILFVEVEGLVYEIVLLMFNHFISFIIFLI